MKKIMVMGAGAQGSVIARRLQEEPSVTEIVCADYDARATARYSSSPFYEGPYIGFRCVKPTAAPEEKG